MFFDVVFFFNESADHRDHTVGGGRKVRSVKETGTPCFTRNRRPRQRRRCGLVGTENYWTKDFFRLR